MRGAVLVSLGLLVGCATLSGLDDKTADLDDDGLGAPGRSDAGGDGSSSTGGPSPGADGSSVDGAPPSSDGSPNPGDGSTGGTRIRNITFEDKKLVDPVTGFDSTTGTPQLLSSNPLVGLHSMFVEANGAYGTVSFVPVPDLFITLRFRVEPAPSGATGAARILRVTHAGGEAIETFIAASPRDLFVVQGNETIGSVPALKTDGAVYRLELRLRSATGLVSILLTDGASTSAVGGGGVVGASSKVEVGAISDGAIRATFDDIFIDSAKQPL